MLILGYEYEIMFDLYCYWMKNVGWIDVQNVYKSWIEEDNLRLNIDIFAAILAYIYFAMFCGILIVNIFVKDAEPGNGNRTKVTRIFWVSKIILLSIQLCVSQILYKLYVD